MRVTRDMYMVLGAAMWVVLAASSPKQAGAERPRDTIPEAPPVLWMNEEKGWTVFVSESTLNSDALSSFSRLQSLESRLRIKREPGIYKYLYHGQQIPECEGRPTRSAQGPAKVTQNLSELILDSPTAFVASVEQIVPGWDAWRGEVALLAYLRVEEILHRDAQNPSPRIDGGIGVLFSGGSIKIHGTTICDRVDESFYRPRIDDRLIVTGAGWEADPRFFAKSEAFPVQGDEILPQPYPALQKDVQRETLTNIRSLLALRNQRVAQ